MSIAAILGTKGTDVIRVPPTTPITDVVHLLGERRIGAVLVMDEPGRVLGILSERDIIGALARHGTAALDQPASALMTQALWTISRDGTTAEAMRIMTDHRVRHLPVMEDGTLVGLVSIGDIVKARLDQQATEVESLRAYVGGMH
ncbi:CBS domain-containing protein [Lichenicoccus sp.]|uniref:CBS domain-containing protein n=1 Tax=Lichenicoccus sp. TaxID=2781899 RepID=UPI003D100D00